MLLFQSSPLLHPDFPLLFLPSCLFSYLCSSSVPGRAASLPPQLRNCLFPLVAQEKCSTFLTLPHLLISVLLLGCPPRAVRALLAAACPPVVRGSWTAQLSPACLTPGTLLKLSSSLAFYLREGMPRDPPARELPCHPVPTQLGRCRVASPSLQWDSHVLQTGVTAARHRSGAGRGGTRGSGLVIGKLGFSGSDWMELFRTS